MTKKPSPSSRARCTQHSRECSNPETKNLLEQLQAAWPTFNLVERGDKLKKLFDLGCFKRGLAADLGVNDKTVRRDLNIAALPQDARTAIAAGCDPEPFLRAAADQQIVVDARERAALERIDGSPSESLAGNMVWLLAKEAGGLPVEGGLLFILAETERTTYERTGWLRRLGTPEPPRSISHDFSFVRLAELCRYRDSDDVLLHGAVIEQLTKVMLSWEPVRDIRDAAFKKAHFLLKKCTIKFDRQQAAQLGPKAYGCLVRSHQTPEPHVWRRAA